MQKVAEKSAAIFVAVVGGALIGLGLYLLMYGSLTAN